VRAKEEALEEANRRLSAVEEEVKEDLGAQHGASSLAQWAKQGHPRSNAGRFEREFLEALQRKRRAQEELEEARRQLEASQLTAADVMKEMRTELAEMQEVAGGLALPAAGPAEQVDRGRLLRRCDEQGWHASHRISLATATRHPFTSS